MDLSYTLFDKAYEVGARAVCPGDVHVLPADLAVLLVGVAARQAASVTALVQVRIGEARTVATVRDAARERLLAPLDGAFNGPMAAALTRWKEE